jgi:hypothetical protein
MVYGAERKEGQRGCLCADGINEYLGRCPKKNVQPAYCILLIYDVGGGGVCGALQGLDSLSIIYGMGTEREITAG